MNSFVAPLADPDLGVQNCRMSDHDHAHSTQTQAHRQRSTGSAASRLPASLIQELTDTYGNAAVQAMLSGPPERVLANIMQASGGDLSAMGANFGLEELKHYLDVDLQFAENEFFRGAKLDGASDTLMDKIDRDGSGTINPAEFAACMTELLMTLAPGANPHSTLAEVHTVAATRFDALAIDGSISFATLEKDVLSRVAATREHRDLFAQLATRLTMDAVDSDQREDKVSARSIGKAEWVTAAIDLHSRRMGKPNS